MPRKKLNSYLAFGDPNFNPDDEDMALGRITSILNKHNKLNFVDRIINKDKYPTIDLGDGKEGTHLMSWGRDENGRPIVFPLIISEGKKLKQLPPYDAMDYAIKNNEYIPFDTEEEADWFSKSYKMYWR